ncbi:50S ribosomal protein L4 [Patescibacteria group bacterium]|nr:50S ribosomal protein L4 [Patescibacteria group bacterium]
MKGHILNTNGSASKPIEVPKFFSERIREDIVSKVLEAKKTKQPYSPSPVAGKQQSASGKMVHRRHVWRSGYGRGMSRVPRKIMLERGSQFNMVAAEVPSVRGGRRAHPPKIISMINTKSINKKEMKIAFLSALSATANKKMIFSKYQSLNEKDAKEFPEFPLIVESKITSLKTKDLIESLKNILKEPLFSVGSVKKKVRSGKGKIRGRRYKRNAGLLIVLSNGEKIKTKIIETKNVKNLSVTDLAKGGLGRITIYTENAINELKQKLGEKE